MRRLAGGGMSALTITLRDITTERDPYGRTILRWRLDVRYGNQLRAVVARSTKTGLVTDIQPLGDAKADWPSCALEQVAARIQEELVRAKLAAALSTPAERRAA